MLYKYKTYYNVSGLPELVKETEYNYAITPMSSSDKIIDFMTAHMRADRETEEYVYVLGLDTKLNPIGVFEISHGTLNTSLISPREVFQKILMCNAYGFVLVHNHPSGDPAPSKNDDTITQRLKNCSDMLGVVLIDSIIIGRGVSYSYANSHRL